jgi:signal transduction histidine kinase
VSGPQIPGLALLCDAEGIILRVVRDELGLEARTRPGQPFTRMLDRGSLTKGLNFLAELRSKEAVFDWEMNVPRDSADIVTLHFAGGRSGDGILIVGAHSLSDILKLYDELMRINNEQINTLRSSMKEQAERARSQAERDGALYNEISRLNNELVAIQRELSKKNAELERLNEQKNAFLGMAAHDLRNPLGAIMTYSEFLAQDMDGILAPEQREFLETIQSSSEFMLRLINDLLDIAKIESGKLQLSRQPIDLAALVRHNVTLAAVMAAKKDISIRLVDEALPAMSVDPTKITQVLNNLISNAIKFSRPGTCITVRVERQGDEALLSVQDQGQGIPAGEFDKLFQPFSRTSVRSTAGEKDTGLGLAIVRRIVTGHGGRIWVDSEVGAGTTFHVALPLNPAPDTPSG